MCWRPTNWHLLEPMNTLNSLQVNACICSVLTYDTAWGTHLWAPLVGCALADIPTACTVTHT